MWPLSKSKKQKTSSNLNISSRIIYVSSIKKSKKRGFWQVKEKVHYYYSFPGLHYLFEEARSKLGFNPLDRQAIYLLAFSAYQFPGYQIKLKMLNRGTESTDFYVEENQLGTSQIEGYLPNEIFKKMTYEFSDIYLKLSKAESSEMFFLRETPIE